MKRGGWEDAAAAGDGDGKAWEGSAGNGGVRVRLGDSEADGEATLTPGLVVVDTDDQLVSLAVEKSVQS